MQVRITMTQVFVADIDTDDEQDAFQQAQQLVEDGICEECIKNDVLVEVL